MQVALVAELFALRLPCYFLIALPDGRQMQIPQALRQTRFDIRQAGSSHCPRLAEELIEAGERNRGNLDISDIGRLLAAIEELPE